MNNWKKALTCALAFSAVAAVAMPSADAAYQLNPEVKHATMALKSASEMGVLCNVNPDLQKLGNKDAIVVMSFGTTFTDTRAKTIDATISDIKKAHPGVKVVTAYTSHIIIDRVKKNEGKTIPTPEQALDQLKAEGYTRVALVSLDVIPGMEYDYKKGVYNEYKNQFKKMTIGTPLLYWQGQENQQDDVTEVIQALAKDFPKQGPNDAILLMAHGTPQVSNAYYSVIQAKINELGLKNVYIYTVEGWPNLGTVMPKLKANNIKNVTLIPFMMVAGDHANNDMAGAEPDSHKSILEAAGYNVKADIRGLGERESVRQVFVNRANAAWDTLEAEGKTAK